METKNKIISIIRNLKQFGYYLKYQNILTQDELHEFKSIYKYNHDELKKLLTNKKEYVTLFVLNN